MTRTTERPRHDDKVVLDDILPLLRFADMIAPMAVRVAATLRLADHVEQGATDAESLAAAADAHPGALGRLMRYLVSRGVFGEDPPGTYALTGMSRLLLDDHPARLRQRFDLDGPVGRGDLSFVDLLETVRDGQPSYDRVYGRSFWEDLDADPDLAARFGALQAANSADSGIDHAYNWSDVGHVVDVGGGNGTLIRQILEAHRHVRGTIVDLPVTAAKARHALARAGLDARCDVVEGSFFDGVPAGADVYVLSKILHDWDDEAALAILRRCAEAAGPGGRVLIAENLPRPDGDKRDFSYLDLHMLLYFGGKERTLAEYEGLAAAAGMTTRYVDADRLGTAIIECTVRPDDSQPR